MELKYKIRILGDNTFVITDNISSKALSIVPHPVSMGFVTSRSIDYVNLKNGSVSVTLPIDSIIEVSYVSGDNIISLDTINRNTLSKLSVNLSKIDLTPEDVLVNENTTRVLNLHRAAVLGVDPNKAYIGADLKIDAGLQINNIANEMLRSDGKVDDTKILVSKTDGSVRVIPSSKYLNFINEQNLSLDEIITYINSPEYNGEYDKDGLLIYIKRTDQNFKRRYSVALKKWGWESISFENVWYEGDDFPVEVQEGIIIWDEGSTPNIDESQYSTGILLFDEGSTPEIDESQDQLPPLWNNN